jgi:hypothetical protein
MANLVLSFAELLVGAVLLDAAIKGDSIQNVVTGKATSHPLPGSSSGAGSGASGAAGGAASTGTGNYVNPVPGARTGRVDQGVDYTLGSAGFVAPGNSKIVYVGSGGGWGAEYVAGQLTDGPLAGSIWYIAEAPSKLAGIVKDATVKAGQQITPGNATIEAGWANPSNPGNPLANDAATGASDQSLSSLTAGYSFSQFVHALGGVPGVFQGVGAALAPAVEQAFSSGAAAGVPFT